MIADQERSRPQPAAMDPRSAESMGETTGLTRHVVATIFSVAFAVGILLFWYRYLEAVASRETPPFLEPLIEELGSLAIVAVLQLLLYAFIVRRPITRANWRQRLPGYAGSLIAFSIVHTTLNWALRSALFPLAGLGTYDYGVMRVRYLMEAPTDIIGFVVFVAAVHAIRAHQASHARELRAEQLERALAQTRLQNLRLQLQPHFLFNALNTISARMYENVDAADEMLTQLAELLRLSLRTSESHEVPLSAELQVLEHYAAIMRGRFGERLQIVVDAPEECLGAMVPSLILQPLVENAVRHGSAAVSRAGRIDVRARRDAAGLTLEVDDDGSGVSPHSSPNGSGVGLRTTEDRLRLLYGAAQRFEAGPSPGGYRVRLTIPFRTDPARALPSMPPAVGADA